MINDRDLLINDLKQQLAVIDARRVLDCFRDKITAKHASKCPDGWQIIKKLAFADFLDHFAKCPHLPGKDLLNGVDPEHLKDTWTQASKKYAPGIRTGTKLYLPDLNLGATRIDADYPFSFLKHFLDQHLVDYEIVS
ncbi:unnamed protein product (mitochondrion) [Plasmodiophora brassicae]|uniref:Uncharacterized protein n=1 Tax=Plasmodiophora brassicae TaxID=37360 RepID=A0A0G4J2I6_PLABS|nr:hypothetical protein PBRA_002185 [Plasmodiophora brassicae]SPQ93152.1 unnamed protein product [Plasmodiophora brassicae]